MKRKKSNVKKIVIIGLILAILLLTILSPFIFINIKLIGDKRIELDYGEKYSEPGFKAYMFNKEITDKIKINNNIKEDIGNYKVTYSYQFFIYKIKRTRKVTIADLTGPEITLKGDKELSITINTKYEEPGYEAIDKLDGDLTKNVIVTNNIDITKLGNYEVVYEVKDNAGNISKEIRRIKVEKLKPTQMSIKDYTLDGWYDSVKLKKTKNYGDEYFNKITMVGDSNTMNMYLNGYLNGLKAWAIPCLHAESMHSIEINLYGLGKKMKLIDAIEKYKPKTIILNFGTFSTAWISEETFIEKANQMIEQIKEKSPNTKIILISIYPIKKGDNINKFQQNIINKYNFLILEMANKHGLKYLDVQEVLKDDDGYGKEEYFVEDKFHLTSLGHRTVKEYIKTHALEED
jgi:hypothetical protein